MSTLSVDTTQSVDTHNILVFILLTLYSHSYIIMSSGGKPGSGGAKRQSVMLQPAAGGSLIPDFVDSEDEEEQVQKPPPPAPAPAQPPSSNSNSHSNIPGGPIPGVQSGAAAGPKSGDPNHRPLVGGFAAAAYEAARAHHYRAKAAQEKRQNARAKKNSSHS